MTEAEWLACTDPQKMLAFLCGRASDRKLRLFACACCRRIWHLLSDERSRRAVEVADCFADGLASREELTVARDTADRAHFEAPRSANFRSLNAAPHTAEEDLSGSAADAAVCAADAVEIAAGGGRRNECRQQVLLLCCIFGNPFRPVPLDPSWLTWHDATIPKLAQAVYEDREMPSGHLDTTRLAILADALEDAGCTDPEILGHCRGPGPHMRGCWIVDLLLNKE